MIPFPHSFTRQGGGLPGEPQTVMSFEGVVLRGDVCFGEDHIGEDVFGEMRLAAKRTVVGIRQYRAEVCAGQVWFPLLDEHRRLITASPDMAEWLLNELKKWRQRVAVPVSYVAVFGRDVPAYQILPAFYEDLRPDQTLNPSNGRPVVDITFPGVVLTGHTCMACREEAGTDGTIGDTRLLVFGENIWQMQVYDGRIWAPLEQARAADRKVLEIPSNLPPAEYSRVVQAQLVEWLASLQGAAVRKVGKMGTNGVIYPTYRLFPD